MAEIMAEQMVVYRPHFWQDAVWQGRLSMLQAASRELTFDELRASEERAHRQWKIEKNWHLAADRNGKIPSALVHSNTAAEAFEGTSRRENRESELAQLALFGVLHWNADVVKITAEHVKLADDHFMLIMARPDLSDTVKEYIYRAQHEHLFYTTDELEKIKQQAVAAAQKVREGGHAINVLGQDDVVLRWLIQAVLFPAQQN